MDPGVEKCPDCGLFGILRKLPGLKVRVCGHCWGSHVAALHRYPLAWLTREGERG